VGDLKNEERSSASSSRSAPSWEDPFGRVRRVLVTGASGLVGRATLPVLLDRGFEVHAVSSSGSAGAGSSVVWHRADLLDKDSTTGVIREVEPTHLLHLAWYTRPGGVYTSSENVRWVDASLHLLREFARCNGRRATVAGTCAEYDWSARIYSEDSSALAPSTLYGACKYSVWLIASRMRELDEVGIGWGRLFSVYGPGEHPDRLVPYVARALLAGQDARCTHGSQIRDLLYSGDAADAFVALLESDFHGPVNIASGRGIPVRTLVSEIGAAVGRPDLIRFGEVDLGEGEPSALVADTRRLTNDVGWSPAVDIPTGVQQTVAWWREHLEGLQGESL
jgi:nucleoside-diphosphate-sugar epimerase